MYILKKSPRTLGKDEPIKHESAHKLLLRDPLGLETFDRAALRTPEATRIPGNP